MPFGILTALLFIFHMQHASHCLPAVVPGYLDFDNLPDTNFSCEGKVIGGYYADVETGCQMFHVCTIGQKGDITDIKFLCLNGTVFDQETRVCERVDEVDCSKTEGFYDLNLELYGSSAALSFKGDEAEGDEKSESGKSTETSDRSSHGHGLKHKLSTSKPSVALPPSSPPIILHPASTTTPKTPVHPFVPTTTYRPNQHLTHFHSSTPPSVAAFLAINNAFSSSNTNQEEKKFEDNSSQYDEGEEEEEDSITDNPEVIINRGMSHHFPVTTVSSHNGLVSPQYHKIQQPNVKVHGAGESGVILNQSDRREQQKSISAHLYGHQIPRVVQDANAHSKHQHNIHLILNQQRESEEKRHHGFKPIQNPDNKNQFLLSTSTQQPPITFTTNIPNGYSATLNSPNTEPFSLRVIRPEVSVQATQQSPSNSAFPPQTNAHQIPPNSVLQQIRSNIAKNGGFLTQTIRISQNPLNFHFSSNDDKLQAHQLFTTPSVAVIATTSSTSSSSSVRSGPTGKVGNISPGLSLTSSIGNSPKGSSVPNDSSVSVQLFSETTPSSLYDEYQEGDVPSDPFFRDVPKISRPFSTVHGIVRKKRESLRKKTKNILLPHNVRYKRIPVAQSELLTTVFGAGKGSRLGGPSKISDEKSSHESNSRRHTRIHPQSKRSTPETKQTVRRLRPSPYVSVTREVSTVAAEVIQQPPLYSDISLLNPAPEVSEGTVTDSSVNSENRQGHRGNIDIRRLHKQNRAPVMLDHHPSDIIGSPDHTEISQEFLGNPRLRAKSTEASKIQIRLPASTSRSAETYEPDTGNIWLNTDSPQPSYFTRNIAIARTHGRGINRQHQHQPSQSNLNVNNSGRSKQRSRQRTTLGTTENAYETREFLPVSSLNSHLRGDTSRRADRKNYDFEKVDEAIVNDTNTESSHNTRSQGRKLYASSVYQDMTRSESTTVKPPNNKTGTTRKSAAESLIPSSTSLPETSFTCADKIPGGYYADLEADCQLFHICSMGRHGKLTDNKFLCGPNTRFNQQSRTCQARHLVDCRLSASLYHLNNHFKLQSPDYIPKYDIGFEAQKIRTKRIAPTAASAFGESSQLQYTINNLPKTSFTCGDKPKDGLYADAETQCQVFHLCRTISGKLTLESSFVCPSGHVFNQAEGSCVIWKEVDCALYFGPQNFKNSTATRTSNEGYKTGNKYRTIENGSQIKLSAIKPPKEEAYYKLGTHKNYKVKRETKKEASDYYFYVDDNYEAHTAKPVNRYVSSGNYQIKQSEDALLVEDYDATAASSEKGKKPEPYLLESQENEEVNQEYIVSIGNVSTDSIETNKNSSEPYESVVKYTAESTSFVLGLNNNESEATVLIPEQLFVQNKSDGSEVNDNIDYVYEYEYYYDDDDDDSATTSPPRNSNHINCTLEENKTIKDGPEVILLDPRHNVNSSCQFVTLEGNGHVENDVSFTSASQNLSDIIAFSTNTTENILYINRNDKLATNQNLKIKIVPKLGSGNGSVMSNDYDHYYSDRYSDSNETETNSNSQQLPSAKTEAKTFIPTNGHTITTDSISEEERDYSAYYVVTEGTEQQIYRPAVEAEENINNKHDSGNFHSTTKTIEKSNTKPVSFQLSAMAQVNFKTGVTDHSTQKSSFTQTNVISELFEINTNSSILQEIDRRTTVTTSAGQTAESLYKKSDDNDHITLASVTAQSHKKTPASSGMETTNSALVSNEKTSASHELNSSAQNEQIIDSTAVSSGKTALNLGVVDHATIIATTPTYGTSSYVDIMPLLHIDVSLTQSPQEPEDKTTVSEATEIPLSSSVDSLFETANVFTNDISTPVPPPAVIQSRETLVSRKPTIRRNHYRGTTNYIGYITEDGAKSRKPYRITPLSNENPVTDVPQQVPVMSSATTSMTTLAQSLVAYDQITADQEDRSQNTVPTIQTSGMFIPEEMSSTVLYLQFGTYDTLKAEIPPSFTKNPKINVSSTDKLLYSYNEALNSSSVSTKSTHLPTFSPLEISLPSSVREYDKHNFITANPSVINNDDKLLSHSRPNSSSTDYEIKKNVKLIMQTSTAAHVLSVDNLAIPITVPSNVFEILPGEYTEVLPNTSPSSHLGYTLSSVSVSSKPGFVCTSRELHKYHPDPDDCRIFHYCSPGFHKLQVLDFRFMCESGTAFKADTQKCEDKFLVPTCINFEDKK